ncbi:hypothetical protein HNP33_002532 [Comamonas odontotermitis]|uniref:Uncharacterized protein n=1 Tax=Comamonas odontotermitis TaxID=379895 RepID=A0ABR6RH14_9BURK|nr:hypothetical protein [Comamonas odontotermitis]MBB6578450.1 hypothetical protein [Comamonas odontotermitis]
MKPSVIYCAPQGSGKTANQQALLERFGLEQVIDNWVGQRIPDTGTLALTHLVPSLAAFNLSIRSMDLTIIVEGWGKSAMSSMNVKPATTGLTNLQLRAAIRDTQNALRLSHLGTSGLAEKTKCQLEDHLTSLIAIEASRANADQKPISIQPD